MKSFQRTLLFSALVFQKRCKGRAFFHTIQIYLTIFLHFYCIFLLTDTVTDMLQNTFLPEHSCRKRFPIPYYIREGIYGYVYLLQAGTGNAAAGFVLSLHRRAEQYRKKGCYCHACAEFVGIWIQEGLKTENCVQGPENMLPYPYMLKGASDGLPERGTEICVLSAVNEELQLAIGKENSGKTCIIASTVSLYGFPL